jgi:hypothetical protein
MNSRDKDNQKNEVWLSQHCARLFLTHFDRIVKLYHLDLFNSQSDYE